MANFLLLCNKKRPIHWRHNLLVALITFSGTILSMIFGKSVLLFLPKRFAGLLGSLIIIAIGGTGLIRYLVKKTAKSPDTARTELRALTTREALLLGFALTVNNVGLGVGASITGLPLLPTALCSFFFSLLFLYLGNRIGRSRLSAVVGRFAEPVADLLMVCLGIYEIFI